MLEQIINTRIVALIVLFFRKKIEIVVVFLILLITNLHDVKFTFYHKYTRTLHTDYGYIYCTVVKVIAQIPKRINVTIKYITVTIKSSVYECTDNRKC